MEAILKKELVVNKAICRVLLVTASVVLISLGAFVRIPLPFSPVPLTLQTFFVLLTAALLGKRLGTLPQIIYLSLGVAGLQIFTQAGAGLLYLSGPTGGYLFGFVFSALFLNLCLKHCKNRFLSVFIAFSLASFLILGCGALWLRATFISDLKNAFMLGFLPFVPGDLIKSAFASALYLKLNKRIKTII